MCSTTSCEAWQPFLPEIFPTPGTHNSHRFYNYSFPFSFCCSTSGSFSYNYLGLFFFFYTVFTFSRPFLDRCIQRALQTCLSPSSDQVPDPDPRCWPRPKVLLNPSPLQFLPLPRNSLHPGLPTHRTRTIQTLTCPPWICSGAQHPTTSTGPPREPPGELARAKVRQDPGSPWTPACSGSEGEAGRREIEPRAVSKGPGAYGPRANRA